MVTITETAAERLQEMLSGKGPEESGLRIYVRPGGCTGFSYAMALDAPHDGDEVFVVHGIQVAVEKDSLGLVDGSEVDFVDDITGQGFRILNPNATSMCGCGSSFRTADKAGQPGSCE